ncbi:MAG TPA: methyltransferase [Pirellulales bacterium]|jgi:hypothetical protein
MKSTTPSIELAQLITSNWLNQAVYVAARLEIADLLAAGPLRADELAARTKTHALSLYRLLRTLASRGIFAEGADGRFQLTPLADALRKDAPDSKWAMAIMLGSEPYHAWGDLLHNVQTGECAFTHRYGKPLFDFLAEHPEKARDFDAAMTSIHGRETAAMLDAYDFSGVTTLVDAGGGNGSTLAEILKRHTSMQGVLFDLPHVVAAAEERLRAAGVASRCRAIGGSFFETAPSGGDAYILRHIIHDWDDEQSVQILSCVRRAMSEKSRLLVVEYVIQTGNEPAPGKYYDLAMMVLPGGMERTEAEYRQLFDAGGLRLARIVPTAADVCVIEAAPV